MGVEGRGGGVGAYSRLGANSRLGAYSNKYGFCPSPRIRKTSVKHSVKAAMNSKLIIINYSKVTFNSLTSQIIQAAPQQ